MPDLRKILFGIRDQNYIDVTRRRAPSGKKAPSSLRVKSKLTLKKKTLKARLKTIKTKKIKLPKVLPKPATPSLKLIKPLKIALKPQKSLKAVQPKAKAETLAGEVTHFFDKIQVCVIKLHHALKTGDLLHFKGRATDFQQTLESMQIDHQPVATAKKGAEVGLKVKREVHVGDKVFLGAKT